MAPPLPTRRETKPPPPPPKARKSGVLSLEPDLQWGLCIILSLCIWNWTSGALWMYLVLQNVSALASSCWTALPLHSCTKFGDVNKNQLLWQSWYFGFPGFWFLYWRPKTYLQIIYGVSGLLQGWRNHILSSIGPYSTMDKTPALQRFSQGNQSPNN